MFVYSTPKIKNKKAVPASPSNIELSIYDGDVERLLARRSTPPTSSRPPAPWMRSARRGVLEHPLPRHRGVTVGVHEHELRRTVAVAPCDVVPRVGLFGHQEQLFRATRFCTEQWVHVPSLPVFGPNSGRKL